MQVISEQRKNNPTPSTWSVVRPNVVGLVEYMCQLQVPTTVARSHHGFPDKSTVDKKIRSNREKINIFINMLFKRFPKEIFYNLKKIHCRKKLTFCHGNLKKTRKSKRKSSGLKISWSRDIFYGPFELFCKISRHLATGIQPHFPPPPPPPTAKNSPLLPPRGSHW